MEWNDSTLIVNSKQWNDFGKGNKKNVYSYLD